MYDGKEVVAIIGNQDDYTRTLLEHYVSNFNNKESNIEFVWVPNLNAACGRSFTYWICAYDPIYEYKYTYVLQNVMAKVNLHIQLTQVDRASVNAVMLPQSDNSQENFVVRR